MLRIATAAVVTALTFAGSASATTLEFTGSNAFGSPNLSRQVDINFTGDPNRSFNNLSAGPFRMREQGTTEEFLAWCFDIFQSIQSPITYTVDPAALDGMRVSLLSRLFTAHVGDLETGTAGEKQDSGAAMQLAIWEIVNETNETDGALSLALDDGVFTATNADGSTTGGVFERAQSYLTSLDDTAGYRFTFYTSDNGQDVFEAAPVPLPAGVILLLTGFGSLALVRRRRKAD
jgi:hypothetical protein